LIEGQFSPRDPFGFLLALVLTPYLGFGWGAYNALLAHLFRFWQMGFSLCFPLLWAGSGVVFNVHSIPAKNAHLVSFNPLLICVELLRYAYYEGYPNDFFGRYVCILVRHHLDRLRTCFPANIRVAPACLEA
jgi:capsular polysaccharide transport system permease protein